MAKSFEITLLIFWVIQAIRQTTVWSYWWQVKEYRFDRFSLLFKDIDGRNKLETKGIFFKFLFILLGLFNVLYLFFLLFYFIFTASKLASELFRKSVRKPVITERAKKILGLNIVLILLVMALFVNGLNLILTLIVGEIVILISPFFGVLLTKKVVEIVKKKEIEKAKKVLASVQPKVIGVTGSYGKTTTKDFIHHFVSLKYQTTKTEGSENTEFGVARKIQKNVKKGISYFVVEMGAYKIGEIISLCEIVPPDIAVITGIEEQHLSLFGSLENIKKAKFELIEALPDGGMAVFNLSNKHCQELCDKAKELNKKLKVYGYLLSDSSNKEVKADLHSRIKSETTKKITFSVFEKGKVHDITTGLHGRHFIENVTGAILVARLLGVSWKDIKMASTKLQEPEGTMRVHEFKNKRIIIDDTRNTTPKGFAAAIDYLSKFKNYRKIVITPGIIELGNKTEEIHAGLAKKLGKCANDVLITNLAPYNQMKNSVDLGQRLALITDNDQIIKYLGKVFTNNTAILLEGRMSAKVMKYVENIRK